MVREISNPRHIVLADVVTGHQTKNLARTLLLDVVRDNAYSVSVLGRSSDQG
jgi:hypothetical protein